MKKTVITRRLAGTILAAALTFGGLVAVGGLESNHDAGPSDEVAGSTWSFVSPDPGKGGARTNGGTWS